MLVTSSALITNQKGIDYMSKYNTNINDESMIIYMFKNKINGKKYVGQTRRTFAVRTQQHLSRRDTYFDRTLAKHGLDNFSYEIIDRGDTLEELNEKERYWIAECDCLWPKGYNLTMGGEGVTGYKHNEERRRKISEAIKGKMSGEDNGFYGQKHTAESRAKMSDYQSARWTDEARKERSDNYKGKFDGENNTFYGKKHKQSSKDRMSKAKDSIKVKVRNIDTGEVFESLALASRTHNVQVAHIKRVCRGQRKTCGGYRWEFA